MSALTSLENFRSQYPASTSGDLQAFTIGYNAAIKDMEVLKASQIKPCNTKECGKWIDSVLCNNCICLGVEEIKRCNDYSKVYVGCNFTLKEAIDIIEREKIFYHDHARAEGFVDNDCELCKAWQTLKAHCTPEDSGAV